MRTQSNNYILDGISNNDPHLDGPLNLHLRYPIRRSNLTLRSNSMLKIVYVESLFRDASIIRRPATRMSRRGESRSERRLVTAAGPYDGAIMDLQT